MFVIYASETWVLKENTIQKLLVFERKILRRIFGPTKENKIWKIKTNEELDKLIKHKNIVLLLLSVGLPVANAPDVLQPCGLLYFP